MENKEFIQLIEGYRNIRQHEDNVMNHRMGWMWALQGLLFNAFALSLDNANSYSGKIILLTLCFLGFFASLSFFYSFYCSDQALTKMAELSNRFLKKQDSARGCSLVKNSLTSCNDLETVRALVTGGYPSLGGRKWFLPWKSLPLVIALGWLFLVVTIV